MSDFLTLCQKFQEKSGITGATIASVLNQTGMNLRMVNWVADADYDIQNLWQDWKFLEGFKVITTVADTDEYSLSALGLTDLVSWDKKRFYINPGTNSYRKLNDFPYDEWLESNYRLGVKVSKEPSQVVIKNDNSLVFIDKPDDAYTIWSRYFKAPTRLAANAETSAIPTFYELIIIHRAKMYAADYLENEEMAATATSDYLAELTKLESAQLPDQETRTRSANDPEDNMILAE